MPENTPAPSLQDLLIAAGGAGMDVMVWPGDDGNGYKVIAPNAPPPAQQKPTKKFMKSVSGVGGVDESAQAYFDFEW